MAAKTRTLNAKDFADRSEIEEKIRALYGPTTDLKPCTIVGTRAELARLHLGDKSTLWGVVCSASDIDMAAASVKRAAAAEKAKAGTLSVPQRGPVYKGGINLPKEEQKKLKE